MTTLGVGLAMTLRQAPTRPALPMESAAAVLPAAPPPVEELAVVPARPVVRYSVIPGGVRDAGDVQHAVQQDDVVRAHYADVELASLTPRVLTADRRAYVSYRKDGRVYWTKQKVQLRRGEVVLTNGTDEVRGRCGNRISMEPLLPVSDEEPGPLELDALVDQEPGLPPMMATSRLANLTMETPAMLMGLGGGSPNPQTPFGGPFAGGPGGAGLPLWMPSGGAPSAASNQPLEDSLQSVLPPAGGAPFPPGGGPQPGGDPNAPGPDGPPGGPNGPGTPGGPTTTPGGPSDVPDTPVTIVVEMPVQPVPVPEPGTMVLIGTGLAGLVARRVRARR